MQTENKQQQTNHTSEGAAVTMYHMGTVDGSSFSVGNSHSMDIHELLEIAEDIANDWRDFVDIRNTEEEGYIGKYAVRRYIELLKVKQDENDSDQDGLEL